VLLRRSALLALSQFGDPDVIAEARRRFAAWLADPASLRGTARQTVLAIVAAHADAATWDRLHALGQQATDITDRTRFYAYLGASHDPALADKALALALTKDPSPTDAPEIIAAVAGVYPDKAWSFAMAHRTEVETLIEPTSRTAFFGRLASGSHDPAMPAKLTAFAKTVPPSAAGEIEKASAAVRHSLDVARHRLPEADRWLAAHPG
jgi:aminopeptidase N